MIPKIARRGSRTIGLLTYLYGPGIRDEHTDPHLVASFGSDAPDPGRDPAATLKDLAVLLDQPVRALPEPNQPKRHVWHCSVRTDPGDRQLSDDEWETVAHRIVTATGIEDPNTGRYCRWAAVRHAPDHIHIVATLICEDGRRPRLHQDAARAQAECRRIETEWGLRLLNAGDGTAAQRPTSAERHKADRHHHDRTPREQLREAVRTALAGATSGEEFFDRLADQGVHVYQRHAPSGDLLGYNVALPGDRTADGSPVWFSGSKLAPDLSWPRIQQRFTTPPSPPPTPQTTPAGARRAAADTLWDATHHLGEGDSASDAAHLAAASEVLDALATTSPAPPAPTYAPQHDRTTEQPAATSAPPTSTAAHCAAQPVPSPSPDRHSAGVKTEPQLPCSCPPSCCSSSRPIAGTPHGAISSRPQQPDRPPNTCARRTTSPPARTSPYWPPRAAPCRPTPSTALPNPCAPPSPRSRTRSSPSRAGPPWPQPSTTPHAKEPTLSRCCRRSSVTGS